MVEKSALGIIEIILHTICAALSLGVLITSGVALSSINEINLFDEDIISDESEIAEDRDRFRAVAGWLLFISIAGIITQAIFLIIRGLYYGEVISSQFIIFGVICTIFSILLAFAFLAGGIPSAVNAADVQEDYLDRFRCDDIQDNFPYAREQCDYIEQLRNSQAAAAALSFLELPTLGVITVIVLVSIGTRRTSEV